MSETSEKGQPKLCKRSLEFRAKYGDQIEANEERWKNLPPYVGPPIRVRVKEVEKKPECRREHPHGNS
jgi:hypothetical protein